MRSIMTAICLLFIGTIPAHNFTLLTIKDSPYNAVGDGVTDDTLSIQSFIDASCPGHLFGPVNQIFPVILPYSSGPYMVQNINATNCLGFAMGGIGSGSTYPVIKQIVGNFHPAIIDMTGSVSGFNLRNFLVYGPLSDYSIPYPNSGILLAESSQTLGTGNYGEIDNVSISGRFQMAGWYTYGVCCSSGTMMGATNAHPSNANSYSWALTNSNIMGISSEFTQIATGSRGASGWKCSRCEMHAFTGNSTLSPKAILLEGTRGFLYSGGIAAAANGFIIETKGNVTGTTLDTVQFYTDQGPLAGYIIGGVTGSLSNLVIENLDATLAAGGGIVGGFASYSGSLIGGMKNAGGVVTNYNFCGMGTAPAVNGCHIP